MSNGGNGGSGGERPSKPSEMFDAATNLVLAIARGSVVGVGKGLTILGGELEKVGEQLKGTER